MKKTTKLLGEDIKTEGQKHIVETVLSEIYGIKVSQVVCCPDCMSNFTVMHRGYKRSDDELMSVVPVRSMWVTLRARVLPVKGTFKQRQFFMFYVVCPFCKKVMFTRIMSDVSYNNLDRKKMFDYVDVFEHGLFMLPSWRSLEVLKHESQVFGKFERKTTGLKVKVDGIDTRLVYFHG